MFAFRNEAVKAWGELPRYISDALIVSSWVHVHTYTAHTYASTYIHIHVHTHTHTHTYRPEFYMQKCTNTHMYSYTHAYTRRRHIP